MDAQRYNELIAFVIRETGWTLDYVRSVPLADFNALVEELTYQKAIDEYRRDYPIAIVVTALTNSRKHPTKPEDYIGQPPQRGRQKEGGEQIWQKAKEAGIQIPQERT